MTMARHFFSALGGRISYRRGFPFATSTALAVVTAALPRLGGAISIWTFALLTLIATAFVLLCGGRFRTFYIAIAVASPFFAHLEWILRMSPVMPGFPVNAVGEYFLYFVVAPILLVWLISTGPFRSERQA